jgi:predicted ATPase
MTTWPMPASSASATASSKKWVRAASQAKVRLRPHSRSSGQRSSRSRAAQRGRSMVAAQRSSRTPSQVRYDRTIATFCAVEDGDDLRIATACPIVGHAPIEPAALGIRNPPNLSEEFAMPRHVLTGAPGAGKTAVLRLLEVSGHTVVEEAATDTIVLDRLLGRAGHDHAFIDRIVTLQRQRSVNTTGTVFFDRSPVCTLALSRFLGLTPTPLLSQEVARVKGFYQPAVFFIRNQGFVERTEARRISFADSLEFERTHEQTYRELGFDLVDVPAGPLTERVALIEQTVARTHCYEPPRSSEC